MHIKLKAKFCNTLSFLCYKKELKKQKKMKKKRKKGTLVVFC